MINEKHRCERCGTILFMGTISKGTKIEIMCKNYHRGIDNKTKKCKKLNIFEK